ncbi:metallophosphoesterase family protein [Bacillus thuringiensis]|uniref:metallophosphoesterase family protein n=1 Tax=Bacillus thuringiensis TaxID=1428 RepID=UPI0026E3339D|nr:metallophosphoesterase [Bacillus thuringiensis]MDO6632229.1 metallophosphoesterase [Bacillus thuringiensis]MDO6661732.1 metallophosphoesterase [Bacillus thuringiensis]MDO6702477.1 metallophosphoesterase [Bacillus thuringiensis]
MKKMKKIITILFITLVTINLGIIKTFAYSKKIEPTQTGSLVFTSDPQYPWTEKTDAGTSETDSEKERRSENFIKNQYKSINEYTSQLLTRTPVLINGDITAYGHGWQWDKINKLLKTLEPSYYISLGNHDIENNLNNTWENNGVINSLENLWNNIRYKKDITRFDFKENIGNEMKVTYGSYGYSFESGPIHSIQLNNDPTWKFNFLRYGTGIGPMHTYILDSSLDWLEQDLKEAYQHGQAIIINMHKPDNWKEATAEQKTKFKELLKTYKVKAVFAGHYHMKSGFSAKYKEFFGDVPVFLSGSAPQQTYLIAEYTKDNMKVYKVSKNDWKNKKLEKTINISDRPYPNINRVVGLFEHANGLGEDFKSSGASHSSWNDKISSIRVPPETSITLYTNSDFTGKELTLSNYGKIPKIHNLDLYYGFNDEVSAYRINTDIMKKPQLFEHINGQGKNLTNAPFSEWNDEVSSILLPPNTYFEMFENTGFTGKSRRVNSGSTPSLINLTRGDLNFNDMMSSYKWGKS